MGLRYSPGGVPRAGNDLIVIQETTAGQVPWKDPDDDLRLHYPDAPALPGVRLGRQAGQLAHWLGGS